jgi:hypothetical protein
MNDEETDSRTTISSKRDYYKVIHQKLQKRREMETMAFNFKFNSKITKSAHSTLMSPSDVGFDSYHDSEQRYLKT